MINGEKMEKISVLVPVYNAEPYLEECIESILSQTYQNIELILVNDGSNDRSALICETFKANDSRVKVWHKENGGVSSSRNFALSVATGDYIVFVDCDDWLEPFHIQKLYDLLKASDADIAVGNFTQFIEDEGAFLIHIGKDDYFERTYSSLEWFEEQYNSDWCLSQCFTVPWAKLYKRSLFEDIVYPTNRKVEDDYTTYKVYLLADKITFMNHSIYNHRKRSTSVTRRVNQADVYPSNSIEERLTLLSLISHLNDTLVSSELNAYKWRMEIHKNEALERGDIEEYKQLVVKEKILDKYTGVDSVK